LRNRTRNHERRAEQRKDQQQYRQPAQRPEDNPVTDAEGGEPAVQECNGAEERERDCEEDQGRKNGYEREVATLVHPRRKFEQERKKGLEHGPVLTMFR
jgi:hypothetical protein